jgi:hypothetical protein
MSDVAKKVLWSIGLSVPSAAIGVILRGVFQAWGIFDPFSEWLGEWLKMHVTPAQVEWTVAGIIAIGAYLSLLWFVWKHHHVTPSVYAVRQTENDRPSHHEQSLNEQITNSPDANLSLVWLNNMLQLCVENNGTDAMFEATIDLSNAGIRGEARRQYAAVWAHDPNAAAKKIFEGDSGFIKLYSHEEYPLNFYTAIFYCQTDPDQFVKTKYYSEDGPLPHIIDISVSSSPRMMGGAKHGRIEVTGEQIKVIRGQIQELQ